MRDMTESLDAARVAGMLASLLTPSSPQALPLTLPAIDVVASTASTNADLRERAASLPGPLLLAAERQTAGRGRAGRRWLSEPGDSLCFSLAWRFAGPLQRVAGLSLAVGVALAECLRAPRIDGRPGAPVSLKWPNDLLIDGAKLGGILIETVGSTKRGAGACHDDHRISGGSSDGSDSKDSSASSERSRDSVWAVIGVGLNVRTNATRDAAIDQPVAALSDAASPDAIDRNALLAQLAAALSVALASFDQDGLEPFVARWSALHAHRGQPVAIVEQGRTLHQGVALGIDEQGCLQLDTGCGIVAVAAGDVSLRATSTTRPASEAPHALH